MSYKRLFASRARDISVFKFTIDTRNIVSGSTDGSENPLTFILPINFPTSNAHDFIISVNDGRPDVVFNRTAAGSVINFATAGIYQITLTGSSGFFFSNQATTQDKLKWIYLDEWGSTFKGFTDGSFLGFSNLVMRFKEPVKLVGGKSDFFKGIKGFEGAFDLTRLDVLGVTNFTRFFDSIQMPFYSALNPFVNATSFPGVYKNVNMTNVSKVEVISKNVNSVAELLQNSGFQGELIIKAPVTQYYALLYQVTNPPALGKIDVRVATGFTLWISGIMTQANVDATLLGWVNNFDWSSTPVIARTVSFNGSKHSNNAAVIAAKQFLESKGFTFSNLTMA